jgi:CHAT domain-containing protein
MKLAQLSIKVLLSITSILLISESANSQIRNMSDITLPSPDSMISEPPSDNAGAGEDPAPVEEPAVVDGEVPVEEGTVNEITPEDANPAPVEEPAVVDGETPTEDNAVNDAPTEEAIVEESNAIENVAPAEEAPTDNLGENTAGDSATVVDETPSTDVTETSNPEPIKNIETSDETPSTDVTETSNPEPIKNIETSDNQGSSSPDLETTEKTPNVQDGAESNEIVEKLVEEADVKDAQAISEAKKDAAQKPEEEEVTEETQEEEEAVAEEKNPEPNLGQLDRVAYEAQFQEAPSNFAIQMQEELQLSQLIDSSGLKIYGTVPSVGDISRRLAQLAEQTGKKPAFINISLQENQLESFVVLPEQTQAAGDSPLVASTNLNAINSTQAEASTLRKTVKNTSREDVIATATQFREEISDVRKLDQSNYKATAQKLYNVLIKPIEADLAANDIDVLVFSMDSGLRLLPVAALYDGKQFLIEKYAMGMVPSFGLTDTRYISPEKGSILAMGASEFKEQAALPTMPIELETVVANPRRGESFLNEQFTIPNFVTQNSGKTPFSIIHLGTHASFKAGDLNDSYIQFYDDKLKIPQLQQLSDQLGWNTNATPIELLVLSACETAIGDQEAELGFAGLAVQAGVKSALASLWYVSDLGTLALMGEFYDQLGNTLVKAEALRQTQLEMLRGNVKVDNRQVRLSNGVGLPLPEDFPQGTLSLDHPYFWSSFTMIGNWN